MFTNANGNINFIDTTANPFDTGFGYANAAIGVFQSFNQASAYPTGQYRYTNLEFYVQDTWKVRPRLTLDYGLRFYYIQPQYDKALQTSTFLPPIFDRSKAPRLLPPGSRHGSGVGRNEYAGGFRSGDRANIARQRNWLRSYPAVAIC